MGRRFPRYAPGLVMALIKTGDAQKLPERASPTRLSGLHPSGLLNYHFATCSTYEKFLLTRNRQNPRGGLGIHAPTVVHESARTRADENVTAIFRRDVQGPHVETHPRYDKQQSIYTVCRIFIDARCGGPACGVRIR